MHVLVVETWLCYVAFPALAQALHGSGVSSFLFNADLFPVSAVAL